MSMKFIIAAAITLAAGTGLALYLLKKKYTDKNNAPVIKLQVETVSELSMDDIVEYFRSLSLDPAVDKPFICQDGELIKKFIENPMSDSFTNLFALGVYNQTDDRMSPMKIISAEIIDKRIAEIMGNDKLVVLS